jgi:hypothetical protein
MKVHLLYADRDPGTDDQLPPQSADLIRDLGLDSVLDQMAGDDPLLRDIASRTLLQPLQEPAEIGYRQAVLADCLTYPDLTKALYDLAGDAIGSPRRVLGWLIGKDPSSVLHRSVQVLELLLVDLRRLHALVDDHASRCRSAGFNALFATIYRELPDDYFRVVEDHLRRLRFPNGVFLTAQLGHGGQGARYVLRRPASLKRSWKQFLLGTEPLHYTYQVAERDQAGFQALADLQSQGINLVADALAQSVDHVLSFFALLRFEIGFYLGCVHLHQALTERDLGFCWPEPAAATEATLTALGLYDITLGLRIGNQVVGNDLDADGVSLVMITGTNQGGKSTLLRSLGVAQLMLQAGLFAPATAYRASVATALHSHFRREEDPGMESGKLDEELARMSRIVDLLTPHSMVLLNESFAATNEREGSHIARQVVDGLRAAHIRVLYVTHLYDLAAGLAATGADQAVFLRPERLANSERTYRVLPGAPQPTSYGPDLYQRVFGDIPADSSAPPADRTPVGTEAR